MTEAGTAEEAEVGKGKDVGVGIEEVAGEVEVLTDLRRGHHHEGKVVAGLVKGEEEEIVALVQVPSNSLGSSNVFRYLFCGIAIITFYNVNV